MPGGSTGQDDISHRNKITEILLDKLILALIVLVAGSALNYRLTKYENALDSQLEKLKAAYNLDRILYEREIKAHENTWKALIDFRQATRSHFGHAFDEGRNAEIKSSAATLISVAEFESLYLNPEAKGEAQRLYLKKFPEFRRMWREDDEGSVMSKKTWTWWAGEIDAVGEKFAEIIHAKRETALRSEFRGPVGDTRATESATEHSSGADG